MGNKRKRKRKNLEIGDVDVDGMGWGYVVDEENGRLKTLQHVQVNMASEHSIIYGSLDYLILGKYEQISGIFTKEKLKVIYSIDTINLSSSFTNGIINLIFN